MRMAGQSITCTQCRAEIEVPTMRGLRNLAPQGHDAATRRAAPSESRFLARGIFVVGLLLVIAGGAIGGGIWFSVRGYETEPSREELERANAAFFAQIDRESAVEFWRTWQTEIIGLPPGQWRESQYAANRRIIKARVRIAQLALALVPIGLAAMIGSAFVRK
jgi:hypothetical protein